MEDMRPADPVVCGSVVVNRQLGKGAGYSDIGIALLVEAGLISQADHHCDYGA